MPNNVAADRSTCRKYDLKLDGLQVRFALVVGRGFIANYFDWRSKTWIGEGRTSGAITQVEGEPETH
jgi:hypothetical protein